MKRTPIEPRLPALPSRGPTILGAGYRENAPMQRRVQGERATVPELDAWLARSYDVMVAELAANLSEGFDPSGSHALVALALEFWTWQRLDRQGLDDAAAAALTTAAIERK
jgi:hypothetical protein